MYNIICIYKDFYNWLSFYNRDIYYVDVSHLPYSLEYYSIELINENYHQFLNYFNYVKN